MTSTLTTPVRRKRGVGKIIWLTVVGIIVAALGFLFWPAHTPAIRDANGNIVPDSIATLEQINLNGKKQWVLIRGHSDKNPILLFLSGGPGGSELAWRRQYNSDLEKNFIVVIWEQRGAGKSFPLLWQDRDRMTLEQYTKDGLALTDYLRQRFHQNKIFVLGHSWGTFLGTWLVQEKPEWFHAYLGVGQMTSTRQDDQMGYQYVLDKAKVEGNTKLVEKLEQNGPPPYFDGLIFMKYKDYLGPLGSYEHTLLANAGGKSGGSMLDMVNTPEYRGVDKLYAFLGLIYTFNVVYPQLDGVDLAEDATQLEVPVFFLTGRHDLNAMASLSESYFNKIEAPYKELIWFEHSGHSPISTEAERFNSMVGDYILQRVFALEPTPLLNEPSKTPVPAFSRSD